MRTARGQCLGAAASAVISANCTTPAHCRVHQGRRDDGPTASNMRSYHLPILEFCMHSVWGERRQEQRVVSGASIEISGGWAPSGRTQRQPRPCDGGLPA